MADTYRSPNPFPLSSPVGLVAGSGTYPLEVARAVRALGHKLITVAHKGESSSELAQLSDSTVWVRVGELGKIIDTFATHGVKNVTFAGGISRPKLFGGVKLDLRGMALIARLKSVRDDVLLRGVAAELEAEGISVFSGTTLLSGSAIPSGFLCGSALTAEQRSDALLGWQVASAIGTLDVGQTVVINQGIVVAVEAVEGTDEAILRAGRLSGPGGVVVKLCKPQQDLRLDLPTIGPRTVRSMETAGCTALILSADRTILLEREQVVSQATKAGIAILSAVSADALRE